MKAMARVGALTSGALALVEAFARALPSPSKYPDFIRSTRDVPISTGHVFVFKTTKGAKHRSQRIRSNRRKAKR